MAKEILLKGLYLRNFKNIKEQDIDFARITNIYGDNGTGKTTIFDAFTWLLFDKDSQDRTTFEIKTLDSSGEPLHGLEHEVTGVLNVDGKDMKLTKLYKEKWTKKRGEAEKQLTGHETAYYIDELPVKQSEYKDKVNSLIDENIFKLITNPLYFSSNMKWQDRRKVLLEIIGDVTTERVINYKNSLRPLEALLVDKDIDTLRKLISFRKRELNEKLKGIPPRIDELNNSIQELDFESLEFQKNGILGGLKDLEDRMLDRSKADDGILADKKKLYELRGQLTEIEQNAMTKAREPYYKLQNDLHQANSELNIARSNFTEGKRRINKFQERIDQLLKDNTDLRNQWENQNSKTLEFAEDMFVCPTCKRPFDAVDIETKKQEMTENFNAQKAENLKAIREHGIKNNESIGEYKQNIADIDIEKYETYVKTLEHKVAELNQKIGSFKPEVDYTNNPEYMAIKNAIEKLEIKVQQPAQAISDVIDLKEKKKELESELEDINKQLNCKDQNEKFRARIKELMDEEKEVGQQIAELEGQEFLTEDFIRTKVELLEGSINSKFKYVSFKLFNSLVNGALEECCEALVNGVPYTTNVNTAAKYNAGLDIINTLSGYYEVYAPIFMDNRESVSEIIETNSQVINLIKPATWNELDEDAKRALAGIEKNHEDYTPEDNEKLEKAKMAWTNRNKKLRVEAM